MMNTEVAVSKVGIIKTPIHPVVKGSGSVKGGSEGLAKEQPKTPIASLRQSLGRRLRDNQLGTESNRHSLLSNSKHCHYVT